MRAPDLLRIQAHANRLANRRLHDAMAALEPQEFHAPRVSFFPSLAETLNHILAVDLYYIGALHGETGLGTFFDTFVPSDASFRGADMAALGWSEAEVYGR